MKEQQRENIKQRKIIEKVYDRKTQEDKSNTTARNKEVLKLAGSSTKSKKKKTSKKSRRWRMMTKICSWRSRLTS